MKRLFVSDDEVHGDRLLLGGSRLHYLRNVLRAKPGDRFMVVRENGEQQLATIRQVTAEVVSATLAAPQPLDTEPPIRITLFQAVIKHKPMSLLIQKCVELGVSAIVPLVTERTVVRLGPSRRAAKQQRWQQVATEAARQSERAHVPPVSEPVEFSQAASSWKAGPGLLFAEREVPAGRLTVAEALKDHRTCRQVAVFVGPEGGLTDSEIELALRHGLAPVTLGPRILRAETAAIVGCALVLYELGCMQ